MVILAKSNTLIDGWQGGLPRHLTWQGGLPRHLTEMHRVKSGASVFVLSRVICNHFIFVRVTDLEVSVAAECMAHAEGDQKRCVDACSRIYFGNRFCWCFNYKHCNILF
jgi:hypothetical protein